MIDRDAYSVDHKIAHDAPQLIGAAVRRVEDPRLITGHGHYVSDVVLPGMLHAAFLRSPEAHARIVSLDLEEARRLPGVFDVVTAEDLKADGVNWIRSDAGYSTWQTSELPLLADGVVRYVGEPIAVVVAESRYVAEDALALVHLELDPLPPIMTMDAALAEDSTPLHSGWSGNCFVTRLIESGDVDAAFAEADHVLSFRFTTQRYAAVPMETRAVAAEYDEYAETLTVWDGTQVPHLARTAIAELIGHPEHRVRVISPDVGGGFGLKCVVFPEESIVPYLARRLGRPVKWVEDRVEHLTASSHARDTRDDLEVAFTEEGVILGLKARVVVDSGAYSVWPFTASMEIGTGMATLPGPYRIRNFRAEGAAVSTNKAPHAPYRGVSRPASCFATERAVDRIARHLDLDPLEVRRRNLIRSDEFPWESAGGYVFDSGSYHESLDRLEELSDLAGWRERQARLRAEGRYLGIGVSCFNEQTAHSFAEYSERGTPVVVGYDKAIVRMDAHGKVTVLVDTHSQGQGHETVYAQLVAAQLAIPFEDVRVRFGDTESAPSGMGTFASRSLVMGGGAIQLATRDLRQKLLRVAASLLEVSADDLRVADGAIFPVGSAWRSIGIAEVAKIVHLQSHKLPPGEDPLLEIEVAYRGDPGRGTFPSCAHLVVVEVDVESGKVTLISYYVVEDCGTIINPMLVDGQIHGGVAQGIGGALHEHFVYDAETGQPLTTTFLEYLMPNAKDIPDVQVAHLCTPSPFTPSGVKGAGEAGTTGAAAAIGNAVEDALYGIGPVLVNELPLTPERVYGYVAEARASSRSGRLQQEKPGAQA